jgi:hypothetical protein
MITVRFKVHGVKIFESGAVFDPDMESQSGARPLDVVYLTASGSDLEYIKSKFEDIPLVGGDSITWIGETAQFIAANL